MKRGIRMNIRSRLSIGGRAPGNGARRGSVLVPVLVAVFSMIVLSSVLMRISSSSSKELTAQVANKRARLMAEMGIAEAIMAIRSGSSGNVGTIGVPATIAGGIFWVEATDLGDDRIQLVSTGLADTGRSALEMIVERRWVTEETIFDSVLTARGRLNLTADVMIDSYDSSLGSYASQMVNVTNGHDHAGLNGTVRSTRDIQMSPRSTVFGDATPGPTHGVSLGPDAYVSGSTTPATDPLILPPINVPAYPSVGPQSIPSNGSLSLPSGNYGFDSLSIGNGATLTITGPAEIVVGNFSGASNANLIIDATAGPVTIYVEGSYSHGNGFAANAVPGSPMALAFMCTSNSSIVFPANTNIRGGYYAPDASIRFTSGGEAWGSFIGTRIVMAAGMRFHYDEALADHFVEETGHAGDEIDALAWYETAVQPDFLARDRRDPFYLLNLDPATLPRPVDAWIP